MAVAGEPKKFVMDPKAGVFYRPLEQFGSLFGFLFFQTSTILFIPFLRRRVGADFLPASLPIWGLLLIFLAAAARGLLPMAKLQSMPLPFVQYVVPSTWLYYEGPGRQIQLEIIFIYTLPFLLFSVAFVVAASRRIIEARKHRNDMYRHASSAGVSIFSRRFESRSTQYVHRYVEPGFLMILGYALCFVTPPFGTFVFWGGVFHAIQQWKVWTEASAIFERQRDHFVVADFQEAMSEQFDDRAPSPSPVPPATGSQETEETIGISETESSLPSPDPQSIEERLDPELKKLLAKNKK